MPQLVVQLAVDNYPYHHLAPELFVDLDDIQT
jgi:hypothetical protein